MKELLSLGFSPCPNDCFIFDALVNGKIDTEGLAFDIFIADVEELNKRAFAKNIAITKLSFHAFAHLINDYNMLNSGSALGFGVGPLLIAKDVSRFSFEKENYGRAIIAIPGKYTTANFLFSLAFPKAGNKVEMLFSEIEEAVLSGKADAGVIIHENRFTYEQKGLKKIIDLGDWWEKQTGHAIPLGGIAIQRSLPAELKQKINRIIRKSIEFAFSNPESSLDFVKKNAQEMSREVMYKHIALYVNKFSVDLGEDGKKAVNILLEKAVEAGVIPGINGEIFIS